MYPVQIRQTIVSLLGWVHSETLHPSYKEGLELPAASCIHLWKEPILILSGVYRTPPEGTMGLIIRKSSLISKILTVIPTPISGDCNQEMVVAVCSTST